MMIARHRGPHPVPREAGLDAVVDAAGLGTWTARVDRRELELNPRAAELLGFSPGELERDAERLLRLCHPDDVDRLKAAIAAHLGGRSEFFTCTFRARHAAGRWIWLSGTGRVIARSSAGRPRLAAGTVHDVSDRKAAEEQLVAATAKFESVFNQSGIFAGIMDLDGYLREVNDIAVRWCGYARAEVLDRPFWDTPWWRGSLETQARIRAATRQARSGKVFREELSYWLADGSERVVDFAMFPIRDDSGQVRFLHPTGLDITERRQADALLARYRLLSENSRDIMVFFRADGTIVEVNDAALAAYGYARDEMIGRPFGEIRAPETHAAFEAQVAEVRHGPIRFETVHLRRDGTRFPVEASWNCGRIGGEEIVLSIIRDISDRKQAEERERLLAREVDHRAKNLLAVIQSVAQLTRADTIEDYKAAVSGRIHALGRAHSLLAGARWQGVDLRRLIEEEIAPFAGGADRAVLDGPPVGLRPETAQALALVIHELATNAAKYGSLSRPTGCVEIAWRLPGRLELEWRESGGPPVAAPTRRGFGTRMISASIERHLDGTLELDWRDCGLKCRLCIPAHHLSAPQEAETAAAAVAPIHEAAVPDGAFTGLRVLLVEDEALVAADLADIMRGAGCDVIGPATRVEDGLTLIAAQRPQAALLDLNLNGSDSLAVADELLRRGIPFAFCTGYDRKTDLPERFGHAPVLPKPFLASEVLRIMGALVCRI